LSKQWLGVASALLHAVGTHPKNGTVPAGPPTSPDTCMLKPMPMMNARRATTEGEG